MATPTVKTLLSPTKMVSNFSTRSFNLPTFGGKMNEIDEESDSLTVKERLNSVFHVLPEVRLNKLNQLSAAEWNQKLKMARVTSKSGRYWQHMGHVLEGSDSTFLYPEEALFLLECNQLMLKWNGVTMSVQSAYQNLILNLGSFDDYRVCSFFSRMGFKVVRHQGKITSQSQPSNSQIKALKHKLRKKVKSEVETIEVDDDISVISQTHDGVEVVNNKETVTLPNFYMQKKITLFTPPKYLLPLNSIPKEKVYCIDINLPKCRDLHQEERKSLQNDLNSDSSSTHVLCDSSSTHDSCLREWGSFKFHKNPWKKGKESSSSGHVEVVSKWNEFKSFHPRKIKLKSKESRKGQRSKRRRLNIGPVEIKEDGFNQVKLNNSNESTAFTEGPIASLWKGKTKPLFMPDKSTSVQNILKTIQLESDSGDPIISDKKKDKEEEIFDLKIKFDLYSPNNTEDYCKSSPPLPNHRIIMMRSDDYVPKPAEHIRRKSLNLGDQIPLVFSVLSSGTVSSYNLFEINLPINVANANVPV